MPLPRTPKKGKPNRDTFTANSPTPDQEEGAQGGPFDAETLRTALMNVDTHEFPYSFTEANTQTDFVPTARSTEFVNTGARPKYKADKKEPSELRKKETRDLSPEIATFIEKKVKEYVDDETGGLEGLLMLIEEKILKAQDVDNQRGKKNQGEPTPKHSSYLKDFVKSLFVFNGNSLHLQRFLHICDCAFQAVEEPRDEKYLINQILAHLEGPAYNKCALHQSYTSYLTLKKDLIRLFGTVRTVGQVQDEVNCLAQGNLDLIAYGHRATQLLSELKLAASTQYGESVARINSEVYEESVTRSYVRGLNYALKLMVAAGQHKTLCKAIEVAENFESGGFLRNTTPYGRFSQRFIPSADSTRVQNNNFNNRTNSANNSFGTRTNFTNNFGNRTIPINNNNSGSLRRPNFNRSLFDRTSNQYANTIGNNSNQRINRTSANNTTNQLNSTQFNPTRRFESTNRRINMMRQMSQPTPHYVKLITNMFDSKLELLVDTGADVSIVNYNVGALAEVEGPGKKLLFGNSFFHSIGNLNLSIFIGNEVFYHEFCIAENNDLPYHGLLGRDFLEKYDSIVNFGTRKLILNPQTNPSEIHMYVSIQNPASNFPKRNKRQQATRKKKYPRLIFPTRNTIRLVNGEDGGDESVPLLESNQHVNYLTLPTHQKFNSNLNIPIENLSRIANASSGEEFENSINNSVGHLWEDDKIDDATTIVDEMLKEFDDVMYHEGDVLTHTNKYEAEIELVKEMNPETGRFSIVQPIYTKEYNVPHALREELYKQVQELVDNGIVEKAVRPCPWNSPVHIVSKKPKADGTKQYRMVVDYRKINQVIVGDHWPLPRIVDLIDRLNGMKYFSTIDLKAGYHQIPFKKGHGQIAAFSVRGLGQFIPKRLLFGLKTSPSVFQRMMDNLVSELPFNTCMVYIDDLCVLGKTLEEHLLNLSLVFQKIREYNLKINIEKSEFLKTEIRYLGYLIKNGEIYPDDSKFDAIEKIPPPKNVKTLQSFLGLVNYYRKFIKGLATRAKPLNELLKNKTNFEWNELCQKAFEELKYELIHVCPLKMPDFTQPFILVTDASDIALGAVLSQSEGKHDRPISYISRVLNNAERNYSTIEKEFLGLVWAVTQFKTYLYGRKFVLMTDHKPLTFLDNLTIESSRLTKLRLKLIDYDFEIKYKPGKENTVADALSRILRQPQKPNESINVLTRAMTRATTVQPMDINTKNGSQEQITRVTSNVKFVENEQPKPDEKLLILKVDLDPTKSILEFEKGVSVTIVIHKLLSIRELIEHVLEFLKTEKIVRIALRKDEILPFVKNINDLKGVLKESLGTQQLTVNLLDQRIVINDPETRERLMKQFHDGPIGGHRGVDKTHEKISNYYIWEGMKKEISEYVKHCKICQSNKTTTIKHAPMQISSTATQSMETIYTDVVGPINPITRNGNNYIITFLDDLTKYVVAVPVPRHDAETYAQVLVECIILVFGTPRNLVSDNAPEFTSEVFRKACKLLKIQKIFTSPYHAQSNKVERVHKDLNIYLSSFANKDKENWDTHLPYYMFSYNTSVHLSTKYTPFELMFGRRVQLPNVLVKEPEPVYNYDDYLNELKYRFQYCATMARENMLKAKERNKLRYDETSLERVFNVGEEVLLRNPTKGKLDPLYVGPYVVEKKTSDVNYQIRVKNKLRTVHVDRLKRFH